MSQLRDPSALKVLAVNLKKYRQAENLSQESLANLAGIEYSQVSRIERQLLNTSISVVFALAAALSIKPSDLLETTTLESK